MTTENATLEGYIAVNAALYTASRPFHALYIDQAKRYDRHLKALAKRAAAKDIPVSYIDAVELNQYAQGNTHGGIVALVGARRFVTLEDLRSLADTPFIVMLDGIEDPYNFGYTVRALYAAGVDGVVVRPRNWTTAASVVGRASAGASERMPMAIAETAQIAADFFREHAFTIATTAHHDRSVSLFDAHLTGKLFLLIGGEKRGITRSFLNQADLIITIPYARPDFQQSLGTVSAASALVFEAMRQRRQE